MGFIRAVVLASLVLGSSCVQFEIPEVETVVGEIVNKLGTYVHYHGNHSDVPTIPPHSDFASIIPRQGTSYWYESISHQGISAFGPGGYQVYRNVKDYGATGMSRHPHQRSVLMRNLGNGVTDDTAAINAAISAGGRCGQGCASSSTTPAVVYFPAGTYLISSSIIDYYYTQLIGNPNSPPTLKAKAGFSGFGLIDGDPYYTSNLNWISTNVFMRQVRNFVFDLTSIPATSQATGIHWPTAQATSIQNVVFQMSSAAGTQHTGLFCESGMSRFQIIKYFN
jgi:glucan 1,3-beta-glucosidase